jgi:hypothetical protein
VISALTYVSSNITSLFVLFIRVSVTDPSNTLLQEYLLTDETSVQSAFAIALSKVSDGARLTCKEVPGSNLS